MARTGVVYINAVGCYLIVSDRPVGFQGGLRSPAKALITLGTLVISGRRESRDTWLNDPKRPKMFDWATLVIKDAHEEAQKKCAQSASDSTVYRYISSTNLEVHEGSVV